MRNFGVAAVVLALFAFAAGVSAEELLKVAPTEPVGVQYLWQGSDGQLSLAASVGMPFEARGVDGVCVASGTVSGPVITLPVRNCGQLIDGTVLWVSVGEHHFQIAIEEWIWN